MENGFLNLKQQQQQLKNHIKSFLQLVWDNISLKASIPESDLKRHYLQPLNAEIFIVCTPAV